MALGLLMPRETFRTRSQSTPGRAYLKLAGSQLTVITSLDDGVLYQTVTLVCLGTEGSVRINDGGSFKLSGDWTPSRDDTLTLFTNDGSNWIEVCRSNN